MDQTQPSQEQQISQESSPVPEYEIGPRDPHSHLKKWVKIGGVIAIILVVVNASIYYWRDYSYKKIAEEAEKGNQRVEEIRSKRQTSLKTFSSDAFGFSVSYPEKWKFEVCEEGGQGIVAFGETEEKLIHCQSEFIPVGPVVIQTFITDNFQIYLSSLVNGLNDSKQENIMLGTKAAVKVSGITRDLEGPALPSGQEAMYVVAYSNGKVYQLGLFEVDGYLDIINFNKVISSFQFIN